MRRGGDAVAPVFGLSVVFEVEQKILPGLERKPLALMGGEGECFDVVGLLLDVEADERVVLLGIPDVMKGGPG